VSCGGIEEGLELKEVGLGLELKGHRIGA